jgi:hypothetical protein
MTPLDLAALQAEEGEKPLGTFRNFQMVTVPRHVKTAEQVHRVAPRRGST